MIIRVISRDNEHAQCNKLPVLKTPFGVAKELELLSTDSPRSFSLGL